MSNWKFITLKVMIILIAGRQRVKANEGDENDIPRLATTTVITLSASDLKDASTYTDCIEALGNKARRTDDPKCNLATEFAECSVSAIAGSGNTDLKEIEDMIKLELAKLGLDGCYVNIAGIHRKQQRPPRKSSGDGGGAQSGPSRRDKPKASTGGARRMGQHVLVLQAVIATLVAALN